MLPAPETHLLFSGNLIAILSSGVIHVLYSLFVDPQDYEFAELDKQITLVEEDLRGLTEAEQDLVELRNAERWITNRGYALTLVLVVGWPIMSIPAGIFTKC